MTCSGVEGDVDVLGSASSVPTSLREVTCSSRVHARVCTYVLFCTLAIVHM